MKKLILLVSLVSAGALRLGAGTGAAANESIQSAVHELYEARFEASRRQLNEYSSAHPGDPLAYALKAASYLFAELDRSGALKNNFLTGDEKTQNTAARPDVQNAAALNEAVVEARRRAGVVLAGQAEDGNALLAMCVAAGVQRDYLALVEGKMRESYPFMRESQMYAARLIKVDATAYDAYLTKGFTEYIVGSLPFYLRWAMRLDDMTGTKQEGLEDLTRAAESGQYMKPFAQLLLAMFYLREKQPEKAERWLGQLTEEYPDNQTFRSELVKLRAKQGRAGD